MKPAPRTPRATVACARCRRQKLKCDPQRPCTLCLHAGAHCEPQTVAERSRLNQKRLSLARAQKKNSIQQSPSNVNDPTQPLSDHHVSPSSLTHSSGSERQRQQQQHNAISSSSMEFARTVDGSDDIIEVGGDPSAAEAPYTQDTGSDVFTFATMPPLPAEVMKVAIEAYFERFHWFVQLLHQPVFVARASSITSRTEWKHNELADVMLVLMVAMCGLRCVSNDPSWRGSQLLRAHSLTATGVVRSLMKEIGVHLYDIMTQSRLETYQITMLLEVYHVYFGSLNFARHMAGVPVRVAHGLGLHRDKAPNMDETTYQVGIRCWNHAVVGELFGSMIYGQPSSLDPDFSKFRSLSELPGDSAALPEMTAALPILARSSRRVSTLTFHMLKFDLYAIIQGILQQIKALNLGNAISMRDLEAIIRAAEVADVKLSHWRENLPEVFDPKHWGHSEPWTALQTDDPHCTPKDRSCRRKLALQGIALQVLHDSVVILAHRPLLQSRIFVPNTDQMANIRLEGGPDPLKISAEAALRISHRPITHFQHNLALSFVFMHCFTAGVILCVPPIHIPYSTLASESKAGVLRIISASRAMSSTNSIARHTDQVLTKLYRKTIQREMDGALRTGATVAVDEPILQRPSQTHSSFTFSNNVNDQPRPATAVMGLEATHYRQNPQQNQQLTMTPPATTSTASSQPPIEVRAAASTPIVMPDDLSAAAAAQPILPYLQFGSFMTQTEPVSYSGLLSEHLDEAFAAFEQMYDLNFMGGMDGDVFDSATSFSGI